MKKLGSMKSNSTGKFHPREQSGDSFIVPGSNGGTALAGNPSDENLIPVDGNMGGDAVAGKVQSLGNSSGGGSMSSGSNKKIFTLTTKPNILSFSTNILKDSPKLEQGASFAPIPILNRSSDVITYINTKNMTLSVTIELYAIQKERDLEIMQKTSKALFALLHPIKSGIQGPPKCLITIGGDDLIDNWECVCTHVGETFEMDAGWDGDKVLPRVRAVTLSFTQIEDDSVDADKISKGDPKYEDPDFYDYGGSNVSNGIAGVQPSTKAALAALQALGSGSSAEDFSQGSSWQLNSTVLGLDLSQLQFGVGLQQSGGASVLNY
jgi:hypothetical protein